MWRVGSLKATLSHRIEIGLNLIENRVFIIVLGKRRNSEVSLRIVGKAALEFRSFSSRCGLQLDSHSFRGFPFTIAFFLPKLRKCFTPRLCILSMSGQLSVSWSRSWSLFIFSFVPPRRYSPVGLRLCDEVNMRWLLVGFSGVIVVWQSGELRRLRDGIWGVTQRFLMMVRRRGLGNATERLEASY